MKTESKRWTSVANKTLKSLLTKIIDYDGNEANLC